MEPKIEVKWVDFECFNSFNCRLLGVTSGSKLPIGGKWNHLQWRVHDEWNQEWMKHQTWSPEVLFRTSDMFKLSQINQDHPFHTNNAKHGNTNMASSWKIIHPASTCLYGRLRGRRRPVALLVGWWGVPRTPGRGRWWLRGWWENRDSEPHDFLMQTPVVFLVNEKHKRLLVNFPA